MSKNHGDGAPDLTVAAFLLVVGYAVVTFLAPAYQNPAHLFIGGAKVVVVAVVMGVLLVLLNLYARPWINEVVSCG